jgi:hypothetical protein
LDGLGTVATPEREAAEASVEDGEGSEVVDGF